MWVYHCLDILNTLNEAVGLYLISVTLLKEPRFCFPFCKYIPPISIAFLTWILTWFSELGAFKIPIIMVFTVIALKISYKDSVYQSITVMELFIVACSSLVDALMYPLGKLAYGNMLFDTVDGQIITRWELYVLGIIIRSIAIVVVYIMLRNFKYKIRANDCVVLSVIFLIEFAVLMFSLYNILNLEKTSDMIIYASSAILSVAFLVIFLYSKNTLYLREQEQKDKIRIAQLQQQFNYYREKQKDEERVRSLYHDMKNHLLVLEESQNTEVTKEMAKQMRFQIGDYEDYTHTGNDFLDIILKDKTEKAREKHIDLSISADFSGMNFIDPLDISTVFGNGLDNAIEASEKLLEEQRVILVKAGKIQNFLFIIIENNCTEESISEKSRTTKNDDFLHGFGISNMQKAAEKYGGQLTTKYENGKFTLKILIPIP